jgi:hypothetical protein
MLAIRFTHETLDYPDRSADPPDPTLDLLTKAHWRREELELGYGVGFGLTARAHLCWAAAERVASDGAPWDASGSEDLRITLAATTPPLAGRIRARIEGGFDLGSGADRRITGDSALALAPFTSGETRSRIGAAVTAALAHHDRPVAVHLHAEAIRVAGGDPPSGVAGAPLRPDFPLVGAGDRDPDRLDLRFAISFTQRRGVLYAEAQWPVLLEGRDQIARKEVPLLVSPGIALRLRGIEFGGQVDLPWVEDDPATAYDPHAAIPDWALRLKFGVDWGIFDRDRDHDRVPDSRDRCPREVEDQDRFQDDDGCPELDNDGDRIPDAADRCPDAAEDRDGFQDEDGCPEPDNDLDGIPDAVDLCPQTAEDPDGFEDDDGCPEVGPPPPPAPTPEPNPQGTMEGTK